MVRRDCSDLSTCPVCGKWFERVFLNEHIFGTGRVRGCEKNEVIDYNY
jgi:hypothetical protein